MNQRLAGATFVGLAGVAGSGCFADGNATADRDSSNSAAILTERRLNTKINATAYLAATDLSAMFSPAKNLIFVQFL
ncbi:MAG: hypothetical protein ACKO2L_21815 [Planctomycetaceae bacterium]